MKIVMFAAVLLVSGCSALGVMPGDLDESIGLTTEENGILCVKASLARGSSRIDYNRLEVSKDLDLSAVTPEMVARVCPQ